VERRGIRGGHRHTVLARQLQHRRRAETAIEMDVQIGLWEGCDPITERGSLRHEEIQGESQSAGIADVRRTCRSRSVASDSALTALALAAFPGRIRSWSAACAAARRATGTRN